MNQPTVNGDHGREVYRYLRDDPATKTGELMTRIMIDVHSDDPKALAAKIDEFCATSDEEPASAKARACALGPRGILNGSSEAAVGGGPARVDQIAFVTVTDEPAADAPSPPDPNKIVERAQRPGSYRHGYHITDMEEIQEFITGMHAEETRSRVIVIADTLVFRFHDLPIALTDRC